MKKKILAIVSIFFISMSCSHTKPTHEGEITDVTGPTTFQAIYKGSDLKVGDQVLILEKENFYGGVLDEKRREVPYKEKRTIIGKGYVSTKLNDNFYELKMDKPQHIPENAIIQKL